MLEIKKIRKSVFRLGSLFTLCLTATGAEAQKVELAIDSTHINRVESVAVSPNGKLLASSGGNLILWDALTGKFLKQLGAEENQEFIIFSPDGLTLASCDSWHLTLWDIVNGQKMRQWEGKFYGVNMMAFSPDGKLLATTSIDGTITIWNLTAGILKRFQAHGTALSVAFSPNGTVLVSSGDDKEAPVKFWDVKTWKVIRSLGGHQERLGILRVWSAEFSPDGNLLATSSFDNTVGVWNWRTGENLQTLKPHDDLHRAITFSPDSKILATSGDGQIKLWHPATGELLSELGQKQRKEFPDLVLSMRFSGDARTLLASQIDSYTARDVGITFWNTESGQPIRTLISKTIGSVALSPDGKTLALVFGGMVKLLNLANLQTVDSLKGSDRRIRGLRFAADGKTLSAIGEDGSIWVWDLDTRREIKTGRAKSSVPDRPVRKIGPVTRINGRAITILTEGSIVKLLSDPSSKEIVRVVLVDENDWAVVTPDGRFDASAGAQRSMHFVVGLESIALDQLKARYYEPGLLAKVLGFNKEELRDISRFENPKLYPDIKYESSAKGSREITVTLTNRGGGIGRVQVFVNGKEFLADARHEGLKQKPNVAQATITIDLSKATGVLPGKDNAIRIVGWNIEDYISSRGTELVWTAGEPTDRAPPEVYAIIGGISNYAGSQLNLNFAAKDAADIANAIGLGAKRLFGADKVHLTLLSTADDPRAIPPTKDNFTKAFADARRAKPTDILVVYLAGHGISLQRGSDMYCYLTKEARTTDTAVLSDSEVRRQETITSEELVDWIKLIPALKQVVMLDTCAAGAAQAQLKLMDKREGSGDAIRALDRVMDRTGSYILLGSTADAPSYEASQYGQGLLTYSLLKGMKGAALNNDEFVDVSKLFQYARDEVEQLAKNIGGIQRPIIFAPKDDSFEIGQMKGEDKQKIVLSMPKPMLLRPRFLDAQADDDTLDLMKALRARLRDENAATGRGVGQGVLIFVDDEEFPGGFRPTGRYAVAGNKVTVNLRLRRDGFEIANAQVTGTKDDVVGLAEKILAAVKQAIGRY